MVTAEMRKIAAREGQDLIVEVIHLGRQKIEFCRGCRVCFDKGEHQCPLKDDLLDIYDKMLTADGLIITSPVYVNDISGMLKNWIDRLAFLCHRPGFAGKQALILTTVGVGPTHHAERTLSYALSSWGYYLAGRQGFKMGAGMPQEEAERIFQRQTKRIAVGFYGALREPPAPSFLSLMTFRIQQGYWWRESQDQSIDYQYWQSQGWIHPKRDYYTPHRASRAKVALARLVGATLVPFVT
jgi:multimeric flavodoxin WrbA